MTVKKGSSKWRWSTLGEVCSKPQYGWTTSGATSGKVKLLRTTDITSGRIDWTDVPFCREEPPEYGKYKLNQNDIVVSRAGSVGVSHLLRNPEEAVFASYLIRFRPGDSVIPQFVAYFLQSPEYWSQIRSNTAGIAIPNVNATKLQCIPIPVPPLDEQRRIVVEIEKQFTRLDAGLASLRRVQNTLKRYRASVLKAACEGRLVSTEAELARRDNRSYQTGEQLLQRILKGRRERWNGKGKYKEPIAPGPLSNVDLPEGWAWTGFEQLADGTKHAIKAGPFGSSLKKSVYTPSGFKIYGQEQVIRGNPYFGDYFISRELFEQLRSCEAKPGDILVSLVGTAGKVLILPDDSVPGIINPRLLKLSLNRSGVNLKFIKILLESSAARAFFKLAAHGGTMEILNLGILKAFPVPLPPLSEQTRIVAEVERRLSVVDELELAVTTNFQHTSALRRSILKRAFTEPKRR